MNIDMEEMETNNRIIKSYEHILDIFQESKKRKMYIYHTGCLPNDRVLNATLHKNAKFLLRMAENGKCNLFQKKIAGSSSYDYIFQY